MVDKVSFMGLGGPNLVKGAVGQIIDAETLGGARMHTEVSGVAHYKAADDDECLQTIRHLFRQMPPPSVPLEGVPPKLRSEALYEVIPADHRLPYRIEDVLERLVDGDDWLEFQPDYAPEFLCTQVRLHGRPIGILANRRGFLKMQGKPRIGGIVYTESARKASYFVENAERSRLPLLYVQDVSGFMVGAEAESQGIIRAGAEMVETMACATVPRIVLTVNHASGAGYYAMAGQGFDPNFTFSWPTARIGVMEGDSAVQAVFGPELERLKAAGEEVPEELRSRIEQTRADYDRWLDARYAAARGHCDAIVDPLVTRRYLELAFDVSCARPQSEHLPLNVSPQ
jgi:acetyl-CoA carboxylase carboxyltransferase component